MTKEDINRVLFLNREILKKYRVKSIPLFGSYVRNEQKEESDIDLLVDFQEGATLFEFVELQDSLSELLAKKVSIVSRRGLSKYIGQYNLKEAEPIGEGL
jgi:hypothetical protein